MLPWTQDGVLDRLSLQTQKLLFHMILLDLA